MDTLSEPLVEVVYDRTREEVPEADLPLPKRIFRMGRWFKFRRREIVSRTGEPTHFRVTYDPNDSP
jgi:hypothetical protein